MMVLSVRVSDLCAKRLYAFAHRNGLTRSEAVRRILTTHPDLAENELQVTIRIPANQVTQASRLVERLADLSESKEK